MLLFVGAHVRPRSLMESLHRDLSYLAGQARNNPTRRPPEFNQVRWERFLNDFKATGLLPVLKRQVEAWDAVEAFVSPLAATVKLKVVKTPIAKRMDWPPEDFLHRLFKNAETANDLKDLDRTLVLIGLKYLKSEAERVPEKRDQKWIQCAWKAVHPELDRTGLLAKFRRESVVIEKLKEFVRGD